SCGASSLSHTHSENRLPRSEQTSCCNLSPALADDSVGWLSKSLNRIVRENVNFLVVSGKHRDYNSLARPSGILELPSLLPRLTACGNLRLEALPRGGRVGSHHPGSYTMTTKEELA